MPVLLLWISGADIHRAIYPRDSGGFANTLVQQLSTTLRRPAMQGFCGNRWRWEVALAGPGVFNGAVRLPSPVWISEGGQARIQPVFAGSPQRHFADRFHQATQAVQA